MSCLVDTHVLLWAADAAERLSRRARTLLEDGDETVFFSIVSLWEIAIKISTGKLRLEMPINELATGARQRGWEFLPLRISHTAGIIRLPYHHRDPFDRMLIAQAAEEKMALISADAAFRTYPVKTIW